MNSNLAAACKVLTVVDELLMNSINFHVDRSSHPINDCSGGLQEGLHQDDGGLLTSIHIQDHKIN
jgi:hypothetical protein